MAAIESETGLRTGTLALLGANLLPLGGVVAFGWQPSQTLFVYWAELGVTLLGYFAVALFAQRAPAADGEGAGWHPGAVPLPRSSGEYRLTDSVPAVRIQNLRYVPAALPLVAILWFLTSRAFLDFPNTEVAVRRSFTASDPYILLAYTPEGLVIAAVAAAIQLSLLGRDFLRKRLVDHYSAPMLVELPIRLACAWFAVTLLLVPVYAGTLLLAESQFVGWTLLVVLVGTKVGIDRALLLLRYEPDPGRLTALFRPTARESD